MALSNLERQQRWQERHLIKLTASAAEIAEKLKRMPAEKLTEILVLLGQPAPHNQSQRPEPTDGEARERRHQKASSSPTT